MGYFIDFSLQPTKIFDPELQDKSLLSTKDSNPHVKNLKQDVLLPTCSFKTGWSTRLLDKREIFRVWGHSESCNTYLKQEKIMNTIPLQPLSVLIHSFIKVTQQNKKAQNQAKRLLLNVTINTTYFPQLDQTMNHTWIDPIIINDNNKKTDKLLVPSAMWDQSIYLTLSGRRGIKLLIKNGCSIVLRSYRRSLLLSFLEHLD